MSEIAETSVLKRLYKAIEPYEIWIVIAAAFAILIPGLWGYTLIDPWETHYSEVARRILADNDWIHLTAEDKSFRSKPVLTFWLIAGSLKLFGVATDGGYSGEFVNSDLAIFAIRLPFALFASMGLVLTWTMLARLVNRRVAWLAFLVLATTPFYFMVARQAITDMPMVACLIGALSCFALAVNAGDQPLQPFWKRVSALHVFLLCFALLVGSQLIYLVLYFRANPGVARGIPVGPSAVIWPLIIVAVLWAFSLLPKTTMAQTMGRRGLRGVLALFVLVSLPLRSPAITKQRVYMLWFYLLIGVSVLAKGPPGIALAGLVCLLYIIITSSWKLLPKLEIIRGVILTALIVLPWHLGMYLKDGRAWYNEYINHHMLNRFGKGVHGDNGTFDYFSSQLGIGMWPWIALLPVALAMVLYTAKRDTQEGRVRLLIGIWAIAGVATFCVSETKFHHYILPAVPALAMLIAFWIDDFLSGKTRKAPFLLLTGAGIAGLVARDFVGEQKQLIELFIYRYDRPWPSGEPWFIDASGAFMAFGALVCLLLAALCIHRWRRLTVAALLLCSLVFAFWTMNTYMGTAAPHWGQRQLHRSYYAQRQIHGVDIEYYSLGDVNRQWGGNQDLLVESVLPTDFALGLPMVVNVRVPGAGVPNDLISVNGKVAKIGDNRFWIEVPQGERQKLADLVKRGTNLRPGKRRPWVRVNADRLIAWQLNWHGEDFWSNGEMYGKLEDSRTIFMSTDNKVFLEWIKKPERANRTFFIITEAGRAKGLRGVLPTEKAKETLENIDTSCNKFTLVRFSL